MKRSQPWTEPASTIRVVFQCQQDALDAAAWWTPELLCPIYTRQHFRTRKRMHCARFSPSRMHISPGQLCVKRAKAGHQISASQAEAHAWHTVRDKKIKLGSRSLPLSYSWSRQGSSPTQLRVHPHCCMPQAVNLYYAKQLKMALHRQLSASG
jgi:hypothetical protein